MRRNICKHVMAILFLFFAAIAIPASKVNAENNVIANSVTIGSYTTEFDSIKSARGQNIKLAAEKIDKVIILPGQEFSFNKAVGPSTEKRGFKLAKVFINGEEHEGFGGGICQVSSTLYNAVMEAGLSISERHEHSKDVKYVPEGKDATASYGGVDFKFHNDSYYPIVIRAKTDGNKVTVDVEAVLGFE